MRVGLTGGLASGKTTVARRLAEAGIVVIDADQLVAELYGGNQPGATAVGELFGADFLSSDGSVDHARLAGRVFADADALRRLEDRIHPLVRELFANRTEAIRCPVVLEATLLVEAGYAAELDLIVSVETELETRLARAVERGLSHRQALARLVAQGDGELRRRASNRIIRNDGSLEQLVESADELAREILQSRREKRRR